MRKNLLDHLVLPHIVNKQITISADAEQQILLCVELAPCDERLVASHEGPDQLTFVQVVHIEKRIVATSGHPWLIPSKLDIVNREEVILHFKQRLAQVVCVVHVDDTVGFGRCQELILA